MIIIKNEEFDDNMSLIFDYSFEFENYCDDTDNEPENLIILYDEVDKLRKEKDILDIDAKIKKSKEIINKFEELIDDIGRDKFKFNDDGSFFYIWRKTNKENKKS